MPRYLQTEVLFCRRPSKSDVMIHGEEVKTERKFAPAVVDLDYVQTANPSWIFDEYDEGCEGYPEPNCTELLLLDGTDLTVKLPFKEFIQYLIGAKNESVKEMD